MHSFLMIAPAMKISFQQIRMYIPISANRSRYFSIGLSCLVTKLYTVMRLPIAVASRLFEANTSARAIRGFCWMLFGLARTQCSEWEGRVVGHVRRKAARRSTLSP